MTVSLTHIFVSPKEDGLDTTLVQPSNWNAEHTLSLAAGKVVGRNSGSAGAAQELPLAFDSTLQSMIPPSGTTGQRPTGAAGMMRYNSTTAKLELYTNAAWSAVGGSAFVGTSAPPNPQAGDLWYNSTTGQLQTYTGTAWTIGTSSISVNEFTGDGSTTAYTLSTAPATENATYVFVSGVYQQKSTYSLSGTTLNLSVAPLNGASIEVTTLATSNIGTPSDGTVTTAKIVDANVTTAKITDANVTLAKLAASVQQALAPAGMLAPFAGSSAPSGWLLCAGQAVSRTTFSVLFAVVSTTYGVGDGTTTFNLPDLRGRTVAGKDDMGSTPANRLTGQSGGVTGTTLGGTGGAEAHTLATAQLPAHSHTYGPKTGRYGSNREEDVFPGNGYPPDEFQPSVGDSNYGTQTMTSNLTGSGSAHNNVQPTIILNYIIKT